jgi:hypothetical protein
MRVPMGIVFAIVVLGVLRNAEAAQQVVVEAHALRYPVGTTLDAAAPIVLVSGEFVVLATDDGRLLRVAGPHDGPANGSPAADGTAVRRALARLVSADRPEVGGVGGVRGDTNAGPRDARPDPWLIDARRSSDQCASNALATQLWLKDAAEGTGVEITDTANGTVARARAAADGRAAWPEELAVQEGRVYLVRQAEQVRSVAIRLHALPPGVGIEGLGAAAWLAAKGCTAQARLLLVR